MRGKALAAITILQYGTNSNVGTNFWLQLTGSPDVIILNSNSKSWAFSLTSASILTNLLISNGVYWGLDINFIGTDEQFLIPMVCRKTCSIVDLPDLESPSRSRALIWLV